MTTQTQQEHAMTFEELASLDRKQVHRGARRVRQE